MKKEEVVYCGIDVAKSHLDIALGEERWRVANTQTGIVGLVKRLKAAAAQKLRAERKLVGRDSVEPEAERRFPRGSGEHASRILRTD